MTIRPRIAGSPICHSSSRYPRAGTTTRVINGKIGHCFTIARRSGTDWYLGAMTDWTSRKTRIPLAFLRQGQYEADIYQDGPDADSRPVEVTISRAKVAADSTLSVRLAKGEGWR